MSTSKARNTEYLVPHSTREIRGEKFMDFTMEENDDGYYSYDGLDKFSIVMEYGGQLYRRTGWNSDKGLVFYKVVERSEIAYPRG